jgi:hypothetical protein
MHKSRRTKKSPKRVLARGTNPQFSRGMEFGHTMA